MPAFSFKSLTAEDLSGTPSDAELSTPVRAAVTLTVYILLFLLIITGIEHTSLFLSVPRSNSNGSLSVYPRYIVRMPYLSPSSDLHLCLFRCTSRFLLKSGALFLLIPKFR